MNPLRGLLLALPLSLCLFAECVAVQAGEKLVFLDDIVNGGFEDSFKPAVGFTYGNGRVSWKMAAPWWIGAGAVASPGTGGKGRAMRLDDLDPPVNPLERTGAGSFPTARIGGSTTCCLSTPYL